MLTGIGNSLRIDRGGYNEPLLKLIHSGCDFQQLLSAANLQMKAG